MRDPSVMHAAAFHVLLGFIDAEHYIHVSCVSETLKQCSTLALHADLILHHPS